MKRSGKFYRNNEAEVMRRLGLQPTMNSGSGWIEKEDGQSENIICQLKSTDASSIKINQRDLDILNMNAAVTHKLPVFAIQFIQAGEIYLLIKPIDLPDAAKYIETGKVDRVSEFDSEIGEFKEIKAKPRQAIKSSSSAREKFRAEQERKFKKERKSAT